MFLGKDGAETSKLSLDNFFRNDFEKGKTDTFDVKGDDVGEIVMVSLNINRMFFKSDWYVAKIVIEKDTGDKKYIFPCYRWVIDQLVVYEGKGIVCTKYIQILVSSTEETSISFLNYNVIL